jgi:NAD(P)-dependent dehydrogenase (short-subunit alcohol dehydrogenase family)
MKKMEYSNNIFNLNNKVSIVTGGATGIGLMITNELISRGSKVYIIGRREEKLKNSTENINKKFNTNKCNYIVGDISNKENVKSIYDTFKNNMKEAFLDILINNAGIVSNGNKNCFEEDVWIDTYKVNCLGSIYMIEKFKDLMKNNEIPSKIINISSINTKLLVSDSTMAYSVSKAALEYYSRQIAANLCKSHNINVNVVCPGPFYTELLTDDLPIVKEFIDKTPNHKIGEHDDIVGIIVSLLSRSGNHIKGQTICVDGGYELTNKFIGYK